jgi:hypothetical protein
VLATTDACLVRVGERHLHLGHGKARVEALGTHLGAVHDGMAPVHLVWVVQSRQSHVCALVTRVHDPPVRLRASRAPSNQITLSQPTRVSHALVYLHLAMAEATHSEGAHLHEHGGHDVEQHAHRMHSYMPSISSRSALDCLCSIPPTGLSACETHSHRKHREWGTLSTINC